MANWPALIHKLKFAMLWKIVTLNKLKCCSTRRTVRRNESWTKSIFLLISFHLESPIWVFMQIAPITNERDTIVLYLCTFTDITALKQPIETEDNRGFPHFISTRRRTFCADLSEWISFLGGLSKFARIAKSVTRNRSILMNFSTSSTKSIHLDQGKPAQLQNVGSKPVNETFPLSFRIFLLLLLRTRRKCSNSLKSDEEKLLMKSTVNSSVQRLQEISFVRDHVENGDFTSMKRKLSTRKCSSTVGNEHRLWRKKN